MKLSRHGSLLLFGTLSVLLLTAPLARAENWPRWRGADGTGRIEDKNAPVEWTADDVLWRTELPGRGQSSPVIWGDRMFLTAAIEKGKERIVLCLDRTSGDILWKKTVHIGDPDQLHELNTAASATCATDGEVVAAFFGRGGLHVLSMDGELLWSKDLQPFDCIWGTAASPVLLGDMVIQNCDADNVSFIVALDRKTGKELWKTPRPKIRGWSTPILVQTPERNELVLNGHTGVTAYDPKTGKELWFCKGDNGRGSPTVAPTTDGKLLIAVSGRPGDMFAMKPGGSGDINNTHEVWRKKRGGGRDLPSPIVVGDFLFVSNMPGIASMYAAKSGELLWESRLGGKMSASPIAVNGLIYQLDESGTIYVVEPEEALVVKAKNSVNADSNEIFRASPAVVDGRIFIRSDRVAYCIGRRAAE